MPPKKPLSSTSTAKLSFASSKATSTTHGSVKPKGKAELKGEKEAAREKEEEEFEKSRGITLDTIEFREAYKSSRREMGVPSMFFILRLGGGTREKRGRKGTDIVCIGTAHPMDQVDVILSTYIFHSSAHALYTNEALDDAPLLYFLGGSIPPPPSTSFGWWLMASPVIYS